MNENLTLRRLRLFLLALTAVLFTGTAAELVLAGHYESALQLVPFVLCGLGLLTLLLVWVRWSRWSLLALRGVMVVALLGSLLGVYEHFEGNLAFDRETHPTATTIELLRAALTGGNPLLAPGALAAAAAVALAATYRIDSRSPEEVANRDVAGDRGDHARDQRGAEAVGRL